MSNDERRRVFVASRDLRDVRQLEALLAGHDWRVADFINVGVCPVQTDENLWAIRVNRASGSHRILSRESGKDVGWRDAQRCQARIGKVDEYPLLLFAHDIHLLHSRNAEKSLPEFFSNTSQFAQRH